MRPVCTLLALSMVACTATPAGSPKTDSVSQIFQQRRPAIEAEIADSLPRQIPIDDQVLTRCPAGSFFGGFRTPAFLPGHRSRRAGIRNPSRKQSFADAPLIVAIGNLW